MLPVPMAAPMAARMKPHLEVKPSALPLRVLFAI
jgi:hypothetical protein